MGADTLNTTSWALAALAVILAWPAPVLLSRARWPHRCPATAMILWQAIGLAGGLSMIGAMLTWGLAPLGSNLFSASGQLLEIALISGDVSRLRFWNVFALSAAALLSAHLLFTLLLTYVRIARQRRRHRELLLLLSSPSAEQPGTLVIDYAVPVAYCLPGGAQSVTVLSAGLLKLLTAEELSAVLSHEKSHLDQRHHLLLLAFTAWKSALPWLPTSQLAQRSVNELIEMLADDASLQAVTRPVLARSIVMVASGSASVAEPAGGVAPPGLPPEPAEQPRPDAERATAERLHRLLQPQPSLPFSLRAGILALAALLLAAPTALLVIPAL